MKHRIKKTIFYFVKVCISFGLIWFALRRVDPENLWNYVHSLPAHLIFLTVLGSAVNLILQFIRFRLIIDECQHQVSTPDLLKVFFLGFAFRLTIPGGHGEAAKMLFIQGGTRNRITAYGLEKITISVVILFLLGPAIVFLFPQHKAFLLVSLIPLVGIVLLYRLKGKPWIKKWQLVGTHYTNIAIKTALLTVVIYGVFISQYWILLRLYSIDWLTVAAICILVMGASALPISVSGLGIRENTTAWLLADYGVAPAIGVGVPLVVFVLNVVIPALIGGVILLTLKKKDQKPEYKFLLKES
ncbi:MAG: lysylphosphatidylglycerol synthase transmembrane domain-containing protein [Candidatus Marinimicrobia bacterium]|nr:lysylphosphatidylglycerol synthase transmembrane domain-containing protein [Candidatus Neomarinimicrobiota bacterium]MDD5582555.1 lysylphosphatidylglycerol synthase transmembrane domain-containing protein [Candidatus Neomarinimicrobiota bacterium]